MFGWFKKDTGLKLVKVVGLRDRDDSEGPIVWINPAQVTEVLFAPALKGGEMATFIKTVNSVHRVKGSLKATRKLLGAG